MMEHTLTESPRSTRRVPPPSMAARRIFSHVGRRPSEGATAKGGGAARDGDGAALPTTDDVRRIVANVAAAVRRSSSSPSTRATSAASTNEGGSMAVAAMERVVKLAMHAVECVAALPSLVPHGDVRRMAAELKAVVERRGPLLETVGAVAQELVVVAAEVQFLSSQVDGDKSKSEALKRELMEQSDILLAAEKRIRGLQHDMHSAQDSRDALAALYDKKLAFLEEQCELPQATLAQLNGLRSEELQRVEREVTALRGALRQAHAKHTEMQALAVRCERLEEEGALHAAEVQKCRANVANLEHRLRTTVVAAETERIGIIAERNALRDKLEDAIALPRTKRLEDQRVMLTAVLRDRNVTRRAWDKWYFFSENQRLRRAQRTADEAYRQALATMSDDATKNAENLLSVIVERDHAAQRLQERDWACQRLKRELRESHERLAALTPAASQPPESGDATSHGALDARILRVTATLLTTLRGLHKHVPFALPTEPSPPPMSTDLSRSVVAVALGWMEETLKVPAAVFDALRRLTEVKVRLAFTRCRLMPHLRRLEKNCAFHASEHVAWAVHEQQRVATETVVQLVRTMSARVTHLREAYENSVTTQADLNHLNAQFNIVLGDVEKLYAALSENRQRQFMFQLKLVRLLPPLTSSLLSREKGEALGDIDFSSKGEGTLESTSALLATSISRPSPIRKKKSTKDVKGSSSPSSGVEYKISNASTKQETLELVDPLQRHRQVVPPALAATLRRSLPPPALATTQPRWSPEWLKRQEAATPPRSQLQRSLERLRGKSPSVTHDEVKRFVRMGITPQRGAQRPAGALTFARGDNSSIASLLLEPLHSPDNRAISLT